MSKILVIDDNELVSTMLREQLSQEGYDVELAHDANQGYASAIEYQPDLILLDVKLPDVVGFDLIRIIKHRDDLVHIPIMMITGTAHSTEEKVKGFQLGADDYVLKPFEMPELLERIKALLRRSANSLRANVPASSRGEESVPVSGPGRSGSIAAMDSPPAAISLGELMEKTFFSPRGVSKELQCPRLALTYVLAVLGFTLLGVAMTAGSPIKPVIAGLWVAGAWGAAVATLVMSCSIMGLHLTWKEGTHLISLSGIPILIKVAGGAIVSVLTGLTPFYYAAGPALVWRGAPWLTERLDLFEIWSAVLLWIFLRQWPGGTRRRSWVATAIVWLVSASLAAVLLKLLEPGRL